jgi:hypothetical protein
MLNIVCNDVEVEPVLQEFIADFQGAVD